MRRLLARPISRVGFADAASRCRARRTALVATGTASSTVGSMPRSAPLVPLPLVLLLSIGLVAAQISHSTKPPKQPNVLFIMADDLGYNDLDWKDDKMHTPNLRNLAFHENTALLTNSYVNQLCTPTRSAFMTGYYPFRIGTQNGVFLHMEPSGVPLLFPFLPENLRVMGYSSYLIGKWHLGYCKKEFLPTNRGFDYFYGFYGPQTGYFNHSADQYNRDMNRVVKGMDLFEEVGDGTSVPDFSQDGVYSTDLFTDAAIGTLDNHNTSKPFFMFLSYQAVHPPLQVPKSFEKYCSRVNTRLRRIYCGQKVVTLQFKILVAALFSRFTDFFSLDGNCEIRNHFLGRTDHGFVCARTADDLAKLSFEWSASQRMLTSMDFAIAKIVDYLKAANMYEDTIIVFTSDNGGTVNFGASNSPLRGEKDTLWEGGTKTTTFVHSPKFIRNGGERKMLFHVVDWHATLLSVAGLAVESYGDGINQWDYIKTGKAKIRRFQFVYSIDVSGSAIREGDYKLILGNPGRKSKEKYDPTKTQLFRITVDPTESKDISRTNPLIVKRMLSKINELKKFMRPNVRKPLSLTGSPENFNGTYSSYWCN